MSRHRLTTEELSASQADVDKAILAERRRIIGLIGAHEGALSGVPGIFGRLLTLIESGEDVGTWRDDPPEDRPLSFSWPDVD